MQTSWGIEYTMTINTRDKRGDAREGEGGGAGCRRLGATDNKAQRVTCKEGYVGIKP